MSNSFSLDAYDQVFPFKIYRSFESAKAVWEQLENEGITTPFQSQAWLGAYIGAHQHCKKFQLCFAELSGPSLQEMILLPLAIYRHNGLTIASIPGRKQASFHMGLYGRNAAQFWTRDTLSSALKQLGHLLKLDLYVFLNQPVEWNGCTNPVSHLPSSKSVSNGYKLNLELDGKKTLERVLSGDTRKKLRKKERWLQDIGPVTYQRICDKSNLNSILPVFFQQKHERFKNLGIDNPFQDPAIQGFLYQGCLNAIDNPGAGIELYAMLCNEKVIATFAGAVNKQRFCGMFNSFDGSPEFARSSPGDQLLCYLIRDQCERGREILDLGVGEAAYKTSFCERTEDLVDVFFPLSWRGRIYQGVTVNKLLLKKTVKSNPVIWKFVNKLRQMKKSDS